MTNEIVMDYLTGKIREPGPGHRSESKAKARRKVGLQVAQRIQPNGLGPRGWTSRGPLLIEWEGWVLRLPGF